MSALWSNHASFLNNASYFTDPCFKATARDSRQTREINGGRVGTACVTHLCDFFYIHPASHVDSVIPDEYAIVPMTWKGAINEGGPEMAFNGTIEEVTTQIQATKPDFTWESLSKATGNTPTVNASKRETEDNKIICGVGGPNAIGVALALVLQQRDYLASLPGTCGVGGGPRVCVRVSCSYRAAVWLCNDNAGGVEPRCSDLAAFVDDIAGKCQVKYRGRPLVRGQEFDARNYNVMVGYDIC
ncbi:hypothetical protein F4677DRAFT_442187 [Hypoxylon crocopeplum]|nr:hypothetical protein F4677DRAFT_442187 [Hypoxylon crocopeplum]